jgi:hypothetical protein
MATHDEEQTAILNAALAATQGKPVSAKEGDAMTAKIAETFASLSSAAKQAFVQKNLFSAAATDASAPPSFTPAVAPLKEDVPKRQK